MNKLFSSLFFLTFIAYIVFAGIDEFIPGFVSDYFNPHILMVFPLGFLFATLLVDSAPQPITNGSRKQSTLLIILSSLATVGILLVGGKELELIWRILVAVFGGLVVAGILTVLLKE